MRYQKHDIVRPEFSEPSKKIELFKCKMADEEFALFFNMENEGFIMLPNDRRMPEDEDEVFIIVEGDEYYRITGEIDEHNPLPGQKKGKRPPQRKPVADEDEDAEALHSDVMDLLDSIKGITRAEDESRHSDSLRYDQEIILQLYLSHLELDTSNDKMDGKKDTRNASDKAISKTKVALYELFNIKIA